MAADGSGAISEALKETVALTLGVSPLELPDDASVDNFPAWTSLQHLAVIAAVEERFEIQMEMDEMTSATSLPQLAAVVAKHRGETTA